MIHFYNWEACETACGIDDLNLSPNDEIELEDVAKVTCPACKEKLEAAK